MDYSTEVVCKYILCLIVYFVLSVINQEVGVEGKGKASPRDNSIFLVTNFFAWAFMFNLQAGLVMAGVLGSLNILFGIWGGIVEQHLLRSDVELNTTKKLYVVYTAELFSHLFVIWVMCYFFGLSFIH